MFSSSTTTSLPPSLPHNRRMLERTSSAASSMIPLSLSFTTSSRFASSSHTLMEPCYLPPRIKPIRTTYSNQLKHLKQSLRDGKCSAWLSTTDAPVAVAIGACILNSLAFPATPLPEDVEAESYIDTAEARFAVMRIVGLIPYFNWASWMFAWLDTGKHRYGVYAVVYLAPYLLRPNFSISTAESWLPIASILLCIAHIQLEASMINGDVKGFRVSNKAAEHLPSITQKKNGSFGEEQRDPPGVELHKNEVQDESTDHEKP